MIDAGIVGIYIFSVLCVGVYYSRGIKTIREFSLSNKRFPAPVIMATISATFIGAEFIFGFAQQSFSVGIIFLFPMIGWCLCKCFIASAIVPRVSRFCEAISVGDIMAEDYGKIGRVVTGLSAAILSIGFVGAQISACGILFTYFFDLPSVVGILIGCGIVVIYSSLGGFRAVAFTDFLQFAVLIVAIPIICNLELSSFGGITKLLEALPKTHVVPSNSALLEQVTWFFIFLIPLLDPAIMQRILMDRDHEKISRAFRLSALTDIPIYLVVCIIGLIALVKNPGLDSNLAFPHILSELPVGIVGLAMAGVLAVIMSTADSFLNVASISLVHDVFKPLFLTKISERGELRLAQLCTAILGTVAIIAALKFPRILDLIIYFQNISWVPLIMAPLYATIFGLRANARAFIASGISGFGLQLLWPVLFGPTAEIVLAGISLLASIIGLLITHKISGGAWPIKKRQLKRPPNYKVTVSSKRAVSFFSSLAQFSKKRVESFGASYNLFGLFAVLNYIVPYFMWSSSEASHFGLHLGLRFVAGILCFTLMMYEYWPVRLQSLLPIYWHVTLMYCLPFFATFMLFENGCSNFWLCNMVLALFLLALLVDWLSFAILITMGTLAGYGLFLVMGAPMPIYFDPNTLYSAIYLYLFAAIIGIIFSQRNEKIIKEKLTALKAVSATIAHELRTPLAAISINAQSMAKYILKYEEGYNLAKSAGLGVPEINAIAREQISEIPNRIDSISQDTQNLINMLLMKVSDKALENKTMCSINACVEKAIFQYPFCKAKKNSIIWNKGEDFNFRATEFLLIHVLFNLLQNSLQAISAVENGCITVWTQKSDSENTLHFKDNGSGVARHIRPQLFEHFISGNENSTGLGLAFCKRVMKSFGGDIILSSTSSLGTEFVLIFPDH